MAKSRKSTIPDDNNPLSALVGSGEKVNDQDKQINNHKVNKQVKTSKGNKVSKKEKQEYSSRKLRFTVNLPEDLIEEVKDCAFWTPGLTLSQFTINAFIEALAKYEKQNGKPFDPRTGELPTGRPPK